MRPLGSLRNAIQTEKFTCVVIAFNRPGTTRNWLVTLAGTSGQASSYELRCGCTSIAKSTKNLAE